MTKSLTLLRQASYVARREIRGGRSAFVLSVLTTMLASVMLSSVLGLGSSLRYTLSRDARTLLGGDFQVSLNARDFTTDELDWLAANSDRLSRVTRIRAASFTAERTSLVEVRAVDELYPLFGEVELVGGQPYEHRLLAADGSQDVPAVVSRELAAALDLGADDTFELGAANLQQAATVARLPDPSTQVLLNAPIIFIARDSLPATGMDQPGTLKSERIRVDIGERDPQQWREDINARYPESDWRVRGTDRVVPGLQDTLARVETLLLLVSLGTMLIAGICVSNTVSAYLRERISTIGVLKSLGMNAAGIRLAYWLVAMSFVVAGALLGLPLGIFIQEVIVGYLSAQLPFRVESQISVASVGIVPGIAILTAWLMTIRPLHTYSSVSPVTLFSMSSGVAEMDSKMPAAGWRELAIPAVALVALLAVAARDQTFLVYFAVGGAVATLLFRLMATSLLALTARLRPRNVPAKIAMRLVSRNAGQISAAAVSLGIGLSALLSFALTEANFSRQLRDTLAAKSPDYYLAGMQQGDEQKIRELAGDALAPENFRTLPTLRAKVTHLAGVPAEEIDAPEDVDWIIHGDRYITWTDDQNANWTGASQVSEGEPWGPDDSRQLVSFDAEAAEQFGLEIGDTIGVRILGEDYDLTIANLRRIDWSTFDVNFVMVLSDGPWEDNPHGYLGSITELAGDHFEFQRQVVEVAPSITPVRTKTIVETAAAMLAKIGVMLNTITLTATAAGMMVLAASIAEGRHRRAHDSVVLRLLGTPRQTLRTLFRVEFVIITALAALPALAVASLVGYSVTSLILGLPWNVEWTTAIGVLAITLAIVLGLGSLSTRKLVTNPPLTLLRNE